MRLNFIIIHKANAVADQLGDIGESGSFPLATQEGEATLKVCII